MTLSRELYILAEKYSKTFLYNFSHVH